MGIAHGAGLAPEGGRIRKDEDMVVGRGFSSLI